MALSPQHDGAVVGVAEYGCVCFSLVLLVINIRVFSFSSSFQFANVFVNLVASGSFFFAYFLLSQSTADDLYVLYSK